MFCCLKAGFSVYGSSDNIVKNRAKGSFSVCSSIETLQCKESGKTLEVLDQKHVSHYNVIAPKLDTVNAQQSLSIGKGMRWSEKSVQPNMMEIKSAQELVDSLLNAGDRLAVVEFYSPTCGGCKTLHPKMSQLAEMYPNAIFLKVNFEEHKGMCKALHVNVLPFFRFYRGAEGRACRFSCTNATIKKFKDALVKHGTESCSLGPAKGLDESEMLALASAGLISIPNSIMMEHLVVKEAAAL